jgi:hypothetical protein
MAFCAAADGSKLPPLVIIPRKNPLPNLTPPRNSAIHYKPDKSTFDSVVLVEVW